MTANVDLKKLLGLIGSIELKSEDTSSAQVLIASTSEKSVRVTWANLVKEVYFDFVQGQGDRHSDWVDFYDGESSEEIGDYILCIVSRFFGSQTRLHTIPGALPITVVQYAHGSEWRGLLQA